MIHLAYYWIKGRQGCWVLRRSQLMFPSGAGHHGTILPTIRAKAAPSESILQVCWTSCCQLFRPDWVLNVLARPSELLKWRALRGKLGSADLQWTTNSWVVWWTVLQLVQLMKPFASRFPSRPPCWGLMTIIRCQNIWRQLTTGLVAALSSGFSGRSRFGLFNCWSNNWVCSHTCA